MNSLAFFVYIVRCSDGSYYSGITSDIEERVAAHNAGLGAAWTAARRPVVLVYSEPAADERSALARERQIKGLSHEKKAALITGDLAKVRALSKRRRRDIRH